MNRKSLKSILNKHIIWSIVTAILCVGVLSVFVYLFFNFKKDMLYLYICLTAEVSIIVLFLLFTFYNSRRIRKVFHNDIYRVSERNFSKLYTHERPLELFKSTEIPDLVRMNEHIKNINANLDKMTILANEPDYSSINLVYSNKELDIVEANSFHQNLVEIILDSHHYRNILIQAYYSFEHSSHFLREEDEIKLIKLFRETFASYKHILYSIPTSKDGIYCYIPQIDTIADIKEKLSTLQKTASLARQSEDGSMQIIPVKFALVCYPYSLINEMFSDIHFAKRMPNSINEYYPDRINVSKDDCMMHESMDLNNMTKILSTIATLVPSLQVDPYIEVKKILNNLNTYLDFDASGMITLDEISDQFYTFVSAKSVTYETYFEKGKAVLPSFVKALLHLKDNDNSYYVSSRNHLSSLLGEAFDRGNIQSGYFYLNVDASGKLRSIVYFINYTKDMVLNSYIKETLLLCSVRLSNFYNAIMINQNLQEEQRITLEILKLSDYGIYKINPKTHQLLYMSDAIMDATHNQARIGDLCYKAIYGLDDPCEKCPLKTNRKMKSYLQPWHIETSLTLNNEVVNDKPDKIMLIHRMNDEQELNDDPYDQDLLVNSYYTLIQSVKNCYLLGGRGYLLLLKLDNQADLIDKFGSETATHALRVFISRIRKLEKVANIYYYKPDAIAVLLSEYGQIDIVNECEKIYEIASQPLLNENKLIFKLSYLPVQYPQGYSSHTDFLRHADRFYQSDRYPMNKDFICFDDSSYMRSANKTEFMLSVIEDKFANKNFNVNLQPIIYTANRKIYAAELLLRLTDEYRNIVFNADELIKTAAKHGKISLISAALLDYIGNLYTQYSSNIFKPYGFNQITINTDSSYLADEHLVDRIKVLLNKYKIPKGFLGFEINEKDIYDHYEEMANLMHKLADVGIELICDRYNGEFISMDKLVSLGISGFKIDRFYTRFIDTDRNKYALVKSLIQEARDYNLMVGLIGVENMNQYNMIKELNPDSYIQGYEFYRPLEKDAFVQAIRSNSSIVKASKKEEN